MTCEDSQAYDDKNKETDLFLKSSGGSSAKLMSYLGDSDDKIKVYAPTADKKAPSGLARIFGLGPFGEVKFAYLCMNLFICVCTSFKSCMHMYIRM